MKEKLFEEPRWKKYQDVEVLNIKVKPTEEDKKAVEEFRRFIDKKEESTKKTN